MTVQIEFAEYAPNYIKEAIGKPFKAYAMFQVFAPSNTHPSLRDRTEEVSKFLSSFGKYEAKYFSGKELNSLGRETFGAAFSHVYKIMWV